MPCIAPLRAYRPEKTESNPLGEGRLVFDKRKSETGLGYQIPCGQCIMCRIQKTYQWSVRCMHENKLHNRSSFVTLTYDDKNLPPNNSLVKTDLQLFMKRLRKKYGSGIRFYACGEYGDTTFRPHYHLLLFNLDFDDKRFLTETARGDKLYHSPELATIWNKGHNWIGSVTYESCQYVARYILKKLTGSQIALYGNREPEFTVMSRRPGIGTGWFDRYYTEAYATDFHNNPSPTGLTQKKAFITDSIIVNGKETPVPKFYDSKFKNLDNEIMEWLKIKRRRNALRLHRSDMTPDRRRVREIIELKRLAERKGTL